jgi:hypothetical protein
MPVMDGRAPVPAASPEPAWLRRLRRLARSEREPT